MKNEGVKGLKETAEHFKESPIIGQKPQWIRYIVEQLGPHFVEAKMIFNARNDGWKASNFHEKCDGQGATVSFIQIKNGACIGGFTTA